MVRFGAKNREERKNKIGLTGFVLLFIFLTLFCPIVARKDFNATAKSQKQGYVLIECSSNRVLKAENEHERLPMASTTKIMTALIAVERLKLDDVVTIPKEAVGVEGSSIYLKLGEKISVLDLLYGLMLRSGNDSAMAIAIHTAGSVSKFVELMNEKAKQLGLKNTSFKNPHGLSEKEHFTSAYDLALIASYAMKNPVFKEIVGTKSHVAKGQSEEEKRYFANKNRILYNYSGGNGIKTGYTTEAGRCLVASSERNSMQVIAVALNYYDYFDFCSRLMDYAYDNYEMQKVIDKNVPYANIAVKKGGKIKKAELYSKNDFFYPVKKDGSEEIKVDVTHQNELVAPHNKETSCGNVKIYIGNCLKFEEKLYTIYNIEKKFSITDFWS